MRRIYLYKRGKFFYCQLRNPETKRILPGKSTGRTEKDDVELVAMSWLANGIPQRRTRALRDLDHVFTIENTLVEFQQFCRHRHIQHGLKNINEYITINDLLIISKPSG